jgi:hypothetical protein
VFGQQDVHYIGDWVNWLTLMHAVYSDDDMRNRIEYLYLFATLSTPLVLIFLPLYCITDVILKLPVEHRW